MLFTINKVLYLPKLTCFIVVNAFSLFQIIFVAAIATFLHAVTNQTVDAMLAMLLILGGMIGVQFGLRFGSRLRSEQMRLFLAILVLGICARLAVDLVLPPSDPFGVTIERVE